MTTDDPVQQPVEVRHVFSTTRTAHSAITVVKGNPSEDQLKLAAAQAFELFFAGEEQGQMGWRQWYQVLREDGSYAQMPAEESYWDENFDGDEFYMVVAYEVYNQDEETWRIK